MTDGKPTTSTFGMTPECPQEDVLKVNICNDNLEVITIAASWKENGKLYWARLPADPEKHNLDEAVRHEFPRLEAFCGRWEEKMLEAPDPLLEGCYVKKPQFHRYSMEAVEAELEREACALDASKPFKVPDLAEIVVDIAAAFQRDAMMYEVFRCHPHRNIAEYYGCIREGDGHFSGICLKRYKCSLYEEMHDHRDNRHLDGDRITEIIQGVRAGLEHLHSLGYIHGDVTPTNIMLHDDGRPVLIDFETCQKLGEVIREGWAETPGYGKMPESGRFEVENDFYMLDIIEQEMKEGEGPFSRA